MVQGLYALDIDCAGLFGSPTPTPALGVKKQDTKEDEVLRLGDLRNDVNPADAQLFPLDFGEMVKSIHNVDIKGLQDWFDLGAGIYNVVESNGLAAEAEAKAKNGTMSKDEALRVKEEKVEVDRDVFSKFVSKAAGFVNVSTIQVSGGREFICGGQPTDLHSQ